MLVNYICHVTYTCAIICVVSKTENTRTSRLQVGHNTYYESMKEIILSLCLLGVTSALLFYLYLKWKASYNFTDGIVLSNYVDILEKSTKIAVIGCIASGKSTLSMKLCNQKRVRLKYIQLDYVYWKPNWTHPSTSEFQNSLQKVIDDVKQDDKYHGYVIDGNFDKQCKNIKWNEVDTVIWLDYNFWIVFYRGIKRTLVRIWNKTPVCNGNIETFPHLLTKNSVPYWVWVCHHKFNDRVATLAKEFPDVKVIRLVSPRQCASLIQCLR